MTIQGQTPSVAPEMRAGLPILEFRDSGSFETWLSVEPRTSKGAWLKLAKKGASLTSVTKPDAIDLALCHGWIDGQQNKYDSQSWVVRFTPRRRASRWSQINRTRALELVATGRMQPPGLAEIDRARTDGRWDAAYAPASTATVPPDLEAALDASPVATIAFANLKRAVRYAVLLRLAALKKTESRSRCIAEFVTSLER